MDDVAEQQELSYKCTSMQASHFNIKNHCETYIRRNHYELKTQKSNNFPVRAGSIYEEDSVKHINKRYGKLPWDQIIA